ncbi:LytTR family DNA-binding domain-containing protein [Pedobacter sp. PF22-3]|uniref:LytR/AlgR family response regulator transcription factor n=1 Tax=Pedobacter sp. PF22-3 TaxID=2994467 RepID=UPI002245AF6E|nr:LytTR family DNA-binding domain-containing protein [Pedobacter sp. PF22-3]MCX2492402.1 LytTR family DNA-binding domain-containing protein [Pedobacter sp. PF22-3]
MKNPISCIIIDDDPTAINILKDHIEEMPRLKVHRVFTKPIEALSEISAERNKQLIFLDIDMPAMSGLRLADNIKHKSHNIIFTTSYPEFALDAFKVRAKHYLLKPFDIGDFAIVVNEVISECYDAQQIVNENEDAFFLRTNGERGRLTKVLKKDIIYIQGSNNHVHIYTPTNDYSVYMTIKEMEEKLKENEHFFRVHKSYIINTSYVKEINGHKIDLGKYEVLMTPQYKEAFMDYIENQTLVSKRLRG